MKVTKIVRDFVEEKVNEKYPQSRLKPSARKRRRIFLFLLNWAARKQNCLPTCRTNSPAFRIRWEPPNTIYLTILLVFGILFA